MAKMTREMQKWLRDFLREEFKDVVNGSTFYYHSGGIKFWGIYSHKMSSKALAEKVHAALKVKAPMIGSGVKVYAGVNPGGHVPVLMVYDQDARDPKLDKFLREQMKRKPKQVVIPLTHINVPVPAQTLRKWKQTLDNILVAQTHLGEIKAITAEMQMLLRAVEPLTKVAR